MKDVAIVSYCRTGIAKAQRSTTSGSTLMELGRRNAKRAVIGVCTAGGMAKAALLER